VGGLATGQASLLAARAVQGAGAALVAPAALALLTTTFAEGRPRHRAMAVYGAISMVGASVGLIGGGVLVRYASWRWVLIVNVPIGIVAAACAARVLPSSQRQRGRLDLPGVITGTVGIASLVYGLSKAAASPNGTSHWGDAHVVTALVASSVLLIAFAAVEIRSRDPLLPVRLLADRNRIGANLILLCGAAAIAGMFFFLTVFMQTVWGYSPLQTGVAYLPLTLGLIASSAAAANLISRLGARPLMLTGTSVSAGSMYWLSRISEHSSYAGAVLGPMLLLAGGMGLLGLPVTLLAMSRVADHDSGIAASVRNTAQQLGASIGLAVLGTVAWTAVADNLRSGTAMNPTDHRAIATGLAEGLLVAAGIMLLALVVAVVAIRVRRADLDSAEP
jgi:MFS family permease